MTTDQQPKVMSYQEFIKIKGDSFLGALQIPPEGWLIRYPYSRLLLQPAGGNNGSQMYSLTIVKPRLAEYPQTGDSDEENKLLAYDHGQRISISTGFPIYKLLASRLGNIQMVGDDLEGPVKKRLLHLNEKEVLETLKFYSEIFVNTASYLERMQLADVTRRQSMFRR